MIALAALLLLAQIANPAPLPERKPCITQERVVGDVAARNPTKELAHVELDEERRKLFVDRYNIIAKAIEGESATAYDVDTVMIVAAKEIPTVLAFAFKSGCLVFQDQIPLGLFVQLIDPTHEFPPKPTEGVAQ